MTYIMMVAPVCENGLCVYPVWPSSGASVRGGAAIYKLGLREVSKGVSSEEVSTLDVSDGRESPAASAHALILNGGNSSLGGPKKAKLMLTSKHQTGARPGARLSTKRT